MGCESGGYEVEAFSDRGPTRLDMEGPSPATPENEGDDSRGEGQGSAKGGAGGDPMRAYRACLHCRIRKTKCNLDANNGRPVSRWFQAGSSFVHLR